MKFCVLIAEDDPHFGVVVRSLMQAEGIDAEVARTRAEIFEKVEARQFDAILLDLVLGQDSGLDVLRELKENENPTPVIVMTAHGSLESVTEALRLNAFDYVTKPFSGTAMLEILKRAVERSRRTADWREKSGEIRAPFIIGQSTGMVDVFKAIARVSGTDATVLITGESGTGKELVARAIHDGSSRSGDPFVAVNCGAFTDTLLESELFGHIRGAFTGADQSHKGIFESGSGGTIFLDEISETSPAFQVKLLRVLQERRIRPLGSTEERAVDVRVIAATNQPLPVLLTSSKFRRDLLYRLSVINIHIPPLRDRPEDIPLLAKSFLKKFNRRQNKKVIIPAETLHWMQSEPWPGNVRELENAIERVVTMNIGGPILPKDLKEFGPPAADALGDASASDFVAAVHRRPIALDTLPMRNHDFVEIPGSLDDITREHLVRVLKHTGGNKLRAAEILGVGRWSLYRMAERLGVNPDTLAYTTRPERKRRTRRAANAAWDDLFDNVNDIVYTRNFEGEITSMNLAGESFFGAPRAKLIGTSLHAFFHDSNLESSLKATNERLLREGTDRSVVNVRDGRGRMRVLESNVTLIRDESGKPAGARGIMRDVTEAKELEAQLREQKEKLEEANEKLKELNRIKADFTAMLVHDLKTPTASMIMTLEYLKNHLAPAEESDSYRMIQSGMAAGEMVLQILRDMMEIFRFESASIELSRSVYTLDEILQDPLEEISVQAKQKNVRLTWYIFPDLPRINVDKMKMKRVFQNLLVNALEATPTGGEIQVEAKTIEGFTIDSGSRFVQISVIDSGEGIEPEHLSYIFDPYRQVNRIRGGTGLGLAIVKRIVSAHGGSVSVRSRLGVGSEFSVTLQPAGTS